MLTKIKIVKKKEKLLRCVDKATTYPKGMLIAFGLMLVLSLLYINIIIIQDLYCANCLLSVLQYKG